MWHSEPMNEHFSLIPLPAVFTVMVVHAYNAIVAFSSVSDKASKVPTF
ncbi:hypothetical protein [Bacillus altitudinis]